GIRVIRSHLQPTCRRRQRSADPATERRNMNTMKRSIALAAGAATLVVSFGLLVSASLAQVRANTWTVTGDMAEGRAGASAVLLLDGGVLIAGGNDGRVSLDSLEIYDPRAAVFTLVTARLHAPRTGHGADRLDDERVAIVGGSDGARALKSIDIFDPHTESITAGPSLATPRAGHSVTRLLDGKVLVA